jgi:hypothetical protein
VALGSSVARPLVVPQLGQSLARFWLPHAPLGIKKAQPHPPRHPESADCAYSRLPGSECIGNSVHSRGQTLVTAARAYTFSLRLSIANIVFVPFLNTRNCYYSRKSFRHHAKKYGKDFNSCQKGRAFNLSATLVTFPVRPVPPQPRRGSCTSRLRLIPAA